MSKKEKTPVNQINFMRLPLVERKRIMAQQSVQMIKYYEKTVTEREEWQAGDFLR